MQNKPMFEITAPQYSDEEKLKLYTEVYLSGNWEIPREWKTRVNPVDNHLA